MKLSTNAFLLILFAITVQGCHHERPSYPPDTSPEKERKKRSLQVTDVDIKLSNFFTVCMHEKTGSVFPSWRSVIDFVLRDTRWYSASDEQYCPHNSDRDPQSVQCWQKRLDTLIRLDSRLLPKAKQCVEEFIWSEEEEPFIIRGKRQAPTHGSSKRESCLGIPRSTYSECVQDKLLTRQNLMRYPSLTPWDGKSVEAFVLEHISDCRITVRYTHRGNVYTETCQKAPKIFSSPPKCISTIYAEIVRASSPLFGAASACTEKYTQDKCKSVRCILPNQHCDKNTRKCVCDPGYEQNARGDCVVRDKCILVYCGDPNEMCDPATGRCICRLGYTRIDTKCQKKPSSDCSSYKCERNEICIQPQSNPYCVCILGFEKINGVCTFPDPCRTKICFLNSHCENRNGQGECVCDDGHKRRGDACTAADPCDTVRCATNMQCQMSASGHPRCVCLPEHVRSGTGCVPKDLDPCAKMNCPLNMVCTIRPVTRKPECSCVHGFVKSKQGPGCVRPDPCDGVKCLPFSVCVGGQCVCIQGFKKNSDGSCTQIDPCSTMRCAINMVCSADPQSGKGVCKCRPGFVRNPRGPGCVRPAVNVCEGFCAANEKCTAVDGRPKCECEDGFFLDQFRECRNSDPCKNINCALNMECKGGNCFCLPEFVKSLRNPGCEQRAPDPCRNVNCPPNSQCVAGKCVCDPGFSKAEGGFCLQTKNKCTGVNCPQNSRCVEGECICDSGFSKTGEFCFKTNGCIKCGNNMRCSQGKCVCLPGFILVPEGTYCTKESGQWMGWSEWRGCSQSCEKGTQLRFRQCNGLSCQGNPVESRACNEFPCIPTDDPCSVQGAQKLPGGNCITCPNGKVFNKCPTICYDRCGGNPRPVNVTTCFTACRPNVYCECPEGMVERSSTDSTCVRRNQCPGTWSKWGDWVRCTESCGGGVQLRSRTCRGTNCEGGRTETRACNTNSCGPQVCKSPHLFVRCPTRCPETCGNRGITITCEAGCRQDTRCVCPQGLLEVSTTNTTCIRPMDCPGVCNPNPCKHGGTCRSILTGYRCTCETGYYGRNCEFGCGDYCRPNGRCENGGCKCNRGYESDGTGSCRRIAPH